MEGQPEQRRGVSGELQNLIGGGRDRRKAARMCRRPGDDGDGEDGDAGEHDDGDDDKSDRWW